MLKKTIILSGLSALAITGLASSAMAGGSRGYEPLYWNGPPGYDYNVLFTKTNKYRSYAAAKSCRAYKRKYRKTGKNYWLRKYRNCKVGGY